MRLPIGWCSCIRISFNGIELKIPFWMICLESRATRESAAKCSRLIFQIWITSLQNVVISRSMIPRNRQLCLNPAMIPIKRLDQWFCICWKKKYFYHTVTEAIMYSIIQTDFSRDRQIFVVVAQAYSILRYPFIFKYSHKFELNLKHWIRE